MVHGSRTVAHGDADPAQRRKLRAVRLALREQLRRDQHVRQGNVALVLNFVLVLMLDSVLQRLGQAPALENRLADRRVPAVDDVAHFGVAELRCVLRAHDDVEAAEHVQQARQQRLVGVQASEPLRDHEARGRDLEAVLPRPLELRLRGRRVGVFAPQLPHRERDRDAADHVEAHASYGFAQVRDVLIDAPKLGRVRHAQQARRERGLRAQDSHDVVGARVGRLQRALDAYARLRGRQAARGVHRAGLARAVRQS